ncbi:hypothetical protein QYM36_016790, partial [Artemia franciscana]
MHSKSGSPDHFYESVYKSSKEDEGVSYKQKMYFLVDEKPALPPKRIIHQTKAETISPTSPRTSMMSKSMNEKIKFFSIPSSEVTNPAKSMFSFIPFSGKSFSVPSTPVKSMINLWTAEDAREIKTELKLKQMQNGCKDSKSDLLSETDKTSQLPSRPPRVSRKNENLLVDLGVERDESGTIVYVTKDVLKPLPKLQKRARKRAGSDSEDHLRSASCFTRSTLKTRSLERGVVSFSQLSLCSLNSVNSDNIFQDMSRSTSFGSNDFDCNSPKPVPPPRRRQKSISSSISQTFSIASSPLFMDAPHKVEKTAEELPVYAQVDKSKKLKNKTLCQNKVSQLINQYEHVSSFSSPESPIGIQNSFPSKISVSSPSEGLSEKESDIESDIRKIENSLASISVLLDGVPSRTDASVVGTSNSNQFSRLVVGGKVISKNDNHSKFVLDKKYSELKTFLKDINVKKSEKEASPSPSTVSADSFTSSSTAKRSDENGSLADISDMSETEITRSVRDHISSFVSLVGNGTLINRFTKPKNKSNSCSSGDERRDIIRHKKSRTLPKAKSEKKMEVVVVDVQNTDKMLQMPIRSENRDSVATTGSDGNQSILESDSDHELKAHDELKQLTPSEKRDRKVRYIVSEIVSSESVFVDCLKLLNNDFRTSMIDINKEEKFMPESEINKFLCDLPQLLTFSTVLLHDLKSRFEKWEDIHKISDIIATVGPFLKMYSAYIRDFEYQCLLFDEFRSKYPRFDQLTRDFERDEKCRMLGIKHYMLKPVQRIPQYRLLLQDYLDHLEESNADYQDTVQALKIVCDVADHANKSAQYENEFHKLLNLQSRLRNYELIRSGRSLIKEGELLKLSRKTLQPRYFILLSDCLLYTTYQGSPPSCKLRVNHELPLLGMDVSTPAKTDYSNEFIVISTTRSLTLIAQTTEERDEWTRLLKETSSLARSKHVEIAALRRTAAKDLLFEQDTLQLGKFAPVWVPDSRVTMCQLCCSSFSVTFRRHHCRACGKVVCTSCSGNQAGLEYLKYKKGRVCDDCYLILS